MTLLDYDAETSGLSQPIGVQGFDAATGAVPVSNGVGPTQAAGVGMKSAAPGALTNGKPLMNDSAFGKPHMIWLILAGGYVLLQWLMKKYNVPRFTIMQNILLVLQYIVIIVALKFVFTWKTVPGVTPVVLNA